MLCRCCGLCSLKALANEDTLLYTQMFPRLPARETFVADTNFVSGTQKNVSDFVQKHFVSATNVSQFAQPKKHHEQQCVRNNVSLFASTFRNRKINIVWEKGGMVSRHSKIKLHCQVSQTLLALICIHIQVYFFVPLKHYQKIGGFELKLGTVYLNK